jgi:hypothetical protein
MKALTGHMGKIFIEANEGIGLQEREKLNGKYVCRSCLLNYLMAHPISRAEHFNPH